MKVTIKDLERRIDELNENIFRQATTIQNLKSIISVHERTAAPGVVASMIIGMERMSQAMAQQMTTLNEMSKRR